MQGRMTVGRYRAIDLTLFAVIEIVFETILVRAGREWFPREGWTVSCAAAVTAAVMIRWGPWCGIHAGIGGIATVMASQGTGRAFAIYGIGNLAALAIWPAARKIGGRRLRESTLCNLLFSASILLSMQGGRILTGMATGMPIEEGILFITGDSISYIFTGAIVWIMGRVDGMLEDQGEYLQRIHEEQKGEGGAA